MLFQGRLFSEVLQLDTGITILAPENLQSPPQKVIYLLHGLCGDNASWAAYTMLPAYAQKSNAIFILPDGGRSFYFDQHRGPAWFTYITQELPRLCGNLLRLPQQRKDTLIMGGSMGGYGALRCALSRPDLYGGGCAFSSACLDMEATLALQRAVPGELTADFTAIFGERLPFDPAQELTALAKQTLDGGSAPWLYLSCGKNDPFLQENRVFHDRLTDMGYEHVYEELEGVHDWGFFDRALHRAIDRYTR